jgi:hypothetical protein
MATAQEIPSKMSLMKAVVAIDVDTAAVATSA